MALYQDKKFVDEADKNTAFDELHKPGVKAPYSGIYRCNRCDWEVVSIKDNELPPQTHHVHPLRTPILWQLIVVPVHKTA